MPVSIATGELLWSDEFSYSDGLLAGNGDWTNGFWTGQPSLRVLSGAAAGPSSDGWADCYTSGRSFDVSAEGRDFIWRSLTVGGQYTHAFCHFLGAAGVNPSGYHIRYSQDPGKYLYVARYDAGSSTVLIASTTMAADGDDVAVRVMPDGTMSLWRKPSGGSWGQLSGNVIDTTYQSGIVGMETYDNFARWPSVEVRSVEAGEVTSEKAGTAVGGAGLSAVHVSGREGTEFTKAGSAGVGT